MQQSQPVLSLSTQACHPYTCMYIRLLDPCFKTGQMDLCSHQGAPALAARRTSSTKGWSTRSLPLCLSSMLRLIGGARCTMCILLKSCCYTNTQTADKRGNAQKSYHMTLSPFTSNSAGSSIVISLYKVLFHLSLKVLVFYWSQTLLHLWIKITTASCTSAKVHDSKTAHRLPECCSQHTGFSPSRTLLSKSL